MVGAADAMLKAADVQLFSHETIGAGLCTAIIRGSVANVAMAIEAGMYEAERIGELNAVMVIPRPLDDLEQTLPIASCWLEKPQALSIPITLKEREKDLLELKEREKDLLELPDLRQLPVQREE
jgi:carbon dioxide concentrating mechanism protein CcmO